MSKFNMGLPMRLKLILDQKTLDKEYAKMGKPPGSFPSEGCARAEWWDDPKGGHVEFVIVGNCKARSIDFYDTLVHEATHVKQHFMKSIGEENPSTEFEAYFMGAVMAELLRQYGRLTK